MWNVSIENALNGGEYAVSYLAWDASYRSTARSVEGGDPYEYTVTQWKGWVTVRNKAGVCLAACELGIERGQGREWVRKCLEVDDVLPEMRETFVDFMAERVLATFWTPMVRNAGIPIFYLKELDREELINKGFVLDQHGQRTFHLM